MHILTCFIHEPVPVFRELVPEMNSTYREQVPDTPDYVIPDLIGNPLRNLYFLDSRVRGNDRSTFRQLRSPFAEFAYINISPLFKEVDIL